jgi:hypothetical protein
MLLVVANLPFLGVPNKQFEYTITEFSLTTDVEVLL